MEYRGKYRSAIKVAIGVYICFTVKNLWMKKPEDWPHDTPHVDPNNRGVDPSK